MKRLGSLCPGQKFNWNGAHYTVYDHAGLMTEVFANERFWAWPSSSTVKLTLTPVDAPQSILL